MSSIRVEDHEVQQMFRELIARGDDMTPVMTEISAIMKEAVLLTFDREGRPSWPALAPATIKAREKAHHWPGKMLVSGNRAGLKENISQTYNSKQAIVGSNKPYGPFLQLGTRKMPARPFLVILPSDVGKIKMVLSDWLIKGKST